MLIAALAAWVSIGRERVDLALDVTTDFNLQAITAVVIGGISLFGGRGSILGMLFGALIVGVMSMGLNMLGADPQWQGAADRHPDHRRRGGGPVDPQGFRLREERSWRHPF